MKFSNFEEPEKSQSTSEEKAMKVEDEGLEEDPWGDDYPEDADEEPVTTDIEIGEEEASFEPDEDMQPLEPPEPPPPNQR
jgi:hypothetical protein